MRTARLLIVVIVCGLTGCQIAAKRSPEQVAPQPVSSDFPSMTPLASSSDDVAIRFAPDSRSSPIEPVSYDEPPSVDTREELLHSPLPTEMEGPEVSLEQLEQMAVANNPAVAQAAAQLRALRGKWVQAGLAPNPTVGYRGEEIGAQGTAGMQGAFVGQQLITGGKLDLGRAVVAQEIVLAEQQLAMQQQRVLTDVRLGYYDVLIAQRKLNLAHELVHVSEQAVEASRKLLRTGEIARIGLLQTEIDARNTRILLRRAENEIRAAWQSLAAVLAAPQMEPMRLEDRLDDIPPQLDFGQQLERISRQSPELAAEFANVARARWAVQRANAEVIPDVNTQFAVMHNYASDFTVAGVQVGLPIPLWNKNQGGVLQAQGELVAARRSLERIELSLRQRLAAVFQQYADAEFQVDLYSAEILPKAKETLDLVTSGYREGELGYLDLLAAQRIYFQTALSYVEALREVWKAAVRIEGLLLEDGLEQASKP